MNKTQPFKKGQRVKMVGNIDEMDPPNGTFGTVRYVRDLGETAFEVVVDWEEKGVGRWAGLWPHVHAEQLEAV